MYVGGPDMAPHTPQRSGCPGEAEAPLDHARLGEAEAPLDRALTNPRDDAPLDHPNQTLSHRTTS